MLFSFAGSTQAACRPEETPRQMNILVADDEPLIRAILCRWCEGLGHACEGVADGNACVRQLREKPYDVLFLDLIMPGACTENILREVRSRHPSLRVVVISVADDEGVMDAMLQKGAVAYLCKPFTKEQVGQVVASFDSPRP